MQQACGRRRTRLPARRRFGRAGDDAGRRDVQSVASTWQVHGCSPAVPRRLGHHASNGASSAGTRGAPRLRDRHRHPVVAPRRRVRAMDNRPLVVVGFAAVPGRRRRREVEMERVLGTPALFATAYGNVGSSIYYALGLTAVYALGLTPARLRRRRDRVRCDGCDLRGGDGTLSGGRGLGELLPARVRRARELHGRLGTDARLRRHRRRLGVLRASLPLDLLGAAAHESVGHRRRRDRHRRARRPQRRRSAGGGEAVHLACRNRLRDADPARGGRLRAGLQPRDPGRQCPLGCRADLVESRNRNPGRDARVHGGGDRLQSRGGSPRSRTYGPELLQARCGRRLRDLLHASARRSLGASGDGDRR